MYTTSSVRTALLVVAVIVCVGVFAQTEDQWEDEFLKIPNAAQASEHLSVYTSMPHVAGTPEDRTLAEFTKKKFEDYGIRAHIDEMNTLLTFPLERKLQMLEPIQYTAIMKEDVEPLDPTSGDPRIIPTFNGYAPNGDVTSQLVYVNYGRKDDFDLLLSRGVKLQGNIAIARYGQIFRGTKAMLAQMYGMIGLIIYSDPKDDGFSRGAVYPQGPWRSNSSVQRGSVQFLSMCPGNPQDVHCSKDPSKHNYTNFIPKIPVQPISWSDAYPFLKNIGGSALPDASWQGALNFTYTVGPGTKTNLMLKINFTTTPIWNVIGEIDGHGPDKDEFVVIGNHRDAWTFGAVDPNSGSSAMLELVRGLGSLLQKGWKPNRSIIVCSWDGEEYGLLGSTGWVNRHIPQLHDKAVVYFNVDSAVSGFDSLSVSGTPSLTHFIRNCTKKIKDPRTGKPLSETWNGKVNVLGSGSDYTAFLDHVGVPSTTMEYDGPYGVYHSAYDSYHWMSTFGDPTFEYHAEMAKFWGLMTMRMADSVVLPFNFTHYAEDLKGYITTSKQLATTYNVTLSYSDLTGAVQELSVAAKSIQQEINRIIATNGDPQHVNRRLQMAERLFIGPGLPDRVYYRHVVQAPGIFEGYSPDVYPGIAQEIRENHQSNAQQQERLAAARVRAVAHLLNPSTVLSM